MNKLSLHCILQYKLNRPGTSLGPGHTMWQWMHIHGTVVTITGPGVCLFYPPPSNRM